MYEFWAPYAGKIVTIDGIECEIRVERYNAIYPYKREVVHVDAAPTLRGKCHKEYRRIKRELRDDWSFDLLQSDNTEIFAQLA